MKVTMKFILTLVAVAAYSVPSMAAVILPSSATSTVAGDAGSSVNYLIGNNPDAQLNLQRPAGTEVPLATGASLADALATVHAFSGTGHTESWTSPTSNGNPVFSFDLGADTDIGSIILWQYGNNGGGGINDVGNHTQNFEVIFHTEAEGGTFDFGGTETSEFNGTMLPVNEPGGNSADNVAQFFGFGTSQTARYVGLRIASNYLGAPGMGGGDRYGLGEVRFATEISAVPEPSSFLLLGLASLLGLVAVRRRK